MQFYVGFGGDRASCCTSPGTWARAGRAGPDQAAPGWTAGAGPAGGRPDLAAWPAAAWALAQSRRRPLAGRMRCRPAHPPRTHPSIIRRSKATNRALECTTTAYCLKLPLNSVQASVTSRAHLGRGLLHVGHIRRSGHAVCLPIRRQLPRRREVLGTHIELL